MRQRLAWALWVALWLGLAYAHAGPRITFPTGTTSGGTPIPDLTCNAEDGFACLTGDVLPDAILPFDLLSTEPAPGSSRGPKHFMTLPDGAGGLRLFSGIEASGNALEFGGRPAFNQVIDGAGASATLTPSAPDGTFTFSNGPGIEVVKTADAPNVVFEVGLAAATKTIWIPAAAMSSSGSCADPSEAVLIASGPKRWSIICTDDNADSVEFDWAFSAADRWNVGTIQIQLFGYSVTNQTTEVVEMDFAGQCVRDGDAVAAHSTTGEQATSVTHGNQANDEQISAASSAITLQGTCNATAHVYMRGQIDATATTYSPMSDWRLLGVKVIYGTN